MPGYLLKSEWIVLLVLIPHCLTGIVPIAPIFPCISKQLEHDGGNEVHGPLPFEDAVLNLYVQSNSDGGKERPMKQAYQSLKNYARLGADPVQIPAQHKDDQEFFITIKRSLELVNKIFKILDKTLHPPPRVINFNPPENGLLTNYNRIIRAAPEADLKSELTQYLNESLEQTSDPRNQFDELWAIKRQYQTSLFLVLDFIAKYHVFKDSSFVSSFFQDAQMFKILSEYIKADYIQRECVDLSTHSGFKAVIINAFNPSIHEMLNSLSESRWSEIIEDFIINRAQHFLESSQSRPVDVKDQFLNIISIISTQPIRMHQLIHAAKSESTQELGKSLITYFTLFTHDQSIALKQLEARLIFIYQILNFLISNQVSTFSKSFNVELQKDKFNLKIQFFQKILDLMSFYDESVIDPDNQAINLNHINKEVEPLESHSSHVKKWLENRLSEHVKLLVRKESLLTWRNEVLSAPRAWICFGRKSPFRSWVENPLIEYQFEKLLIKSKVLEEQDLCIESLLLEENFEKYLTLFGAKYQITQRAELTAPEDKK